MKITVITDIHGRYENVEKLAAKLERPDLILVCGDITHFGGADEAERVLAPLRKKATVLAVAGNCDQPSVTEFLVEQNLSVHATWRRMDDVVIAGMGYSTPCPCETPGVMSESEFDAMFMKLNENLPEDCSLVFVSHQPPFNTKLDDVGGGNHVGSKAFRRFVEERHPTLCCCGHIHEATGEDSIGVSKLINPGPLRDGFYLEVDLLNYINYIGIKSI